MAEINHISRYHPPAADTVTTTPSSKNAMETMKGVLERRRERVGEPTEKAGIFPGTVAALYLMEAFVMDTELFEVAIGYQLST